MYIALRRTRDIAAELGRTKGGRLLVDSLWRPTTRRRTPKPNSRRRISTSSCSTSLRDAGAGFRGDTNKVTFIDRAGREELPLMAKREVAARIADQIEKFFAR